MRLKRLRQFRLREAVHLDVAILRLDSQERVSDASADKQRPSARVPNDLADAT